MSSNRSYFTQPSYVISAAVSLAVLDIVAVALRFWARRRQREALKTDDWLMLPAVLLVTGNAIAITYGVCRGAIAHKTRFPADFAGNPFEITTPQIAMVYKIQWAFDLMLPLALGSIRASFLFFYRRIFVVETKSKANYILSGLIIVVALWSISLFFVSFFQCKLNFWGIWGSAPDIQHYFTDNMSLVLSVSITGFMIDFAVIVVPVPLVWRLNLSTGRKVSVAAIFLLGSASIVASLVRLIMMVRLIAIGFSADEDRILVVTEYIYWGTIESGVGVVATCLPTLQFLLRLCSWEPILKTAKAVISFRGSSKNYIISKDTAHNNGQLEVVQLAKQESKTRTANSGDASRSTKSGQVWLENMEVTRAG